MSGNEDQAEDEFGTLYRFVPSVRRGFQPSKQFDPNALPDSAQPGFGITVTSKAKAREGSKQRSDATWDATEKGTVDLSLYGPGDVEGLDHTQIVRAEPDPGSQQFQPNYFPFVSFDRPDLPWMFSPERAGSDGRIRPWLTLITVEKAEGVSIDPSGRRPLPVLTFEDEADPKAELPPPDETWAWAHAQLHGAPAGKRQSDWMEWGPEQFSELSNITVSRLVSPRNLDRGTDYYAAVVPTFEPGRLAGLGEDPSENGESLEYAWRLDGSLPRPFELPVYYYWEFATTDRDVSFERYVERLETVTFGEDVGTKVIDASDPGPESLQPGGGGTGTTETVAFGGALISEPGRDRVDRLSYTLSDRLRDLLNKPETLRTSADGATLPILGPPLYGQWHAGLEGIPPALAADDDRYDPTWFRELNQNVRTRGAASRGAKLVTRNQSALMNAAWEVAGEIREANRSIRDTQAAGVLGDAIEGPHGPDGRSFTPGEFAKRSARTLERINRIALLENLPGGDGLPGEPDLPGEDGVGLPEGVTMPPEGGYVMPGEFTIPRDWYTMPQEGPVDPASGSPTGGGPARGGAVERYTMANSSGTATGVSGIDPIRLTAGSTETGITTDPTPTDPMVDVTGRETPGMVEGGDDASDAGATTDDDGSSGLYAQFLQDLDARPETSRQFQRLVRLDGPLASRTGATALDYERLVGRVANETLHEVEVLADAIEQRIQVRPFAPNGEFWVPRLDASERVDSPPADGTPPEEGTGTEPPPRRDAGDATAGEGSAGSTAERAAETPSDGRSSEEGTGRTAVTTGFASMGVATSGGRSGTVTGPGMGSSGRMAPVPTATAEREYRETAARLDDRLPSDERLEPRPGGGGSTSEGAGSGVTTDAESTPDDDGTEGSTETGGDTGSDDGDATGMASVLHRLEAMESRVDDVVAAIPDDPEATLDADALRSVDQAVDSVVDGLEAVERSVPDLLSDGEELPEGTAPRDVRSRLGTLSRAVAGLADSLPAATEGDAAPDPSGIDAAAIERAARDVRTEARTLRELLGGLDLTVPLTLRTTATSSETARGDQTRTPSIRVDRSVLGDVTLSGSQSAYFRGRLRRRIGTATGDQFVKPSDPVDRVMLAPEFPTPMWRPLRDLATEYMLPGIDQVPPDSVGLLTENREFIEAYMTGLNHEFARELLWQGFPTDRGGTYFKRFWNKGRGPAWDLGMGVSTEQDSPRDIAPIHDWDETPLGENGPAGANEGDDGSPKVVLLLRSRLFKLFPHVNVYAGRAYLSEEGRVVPTTPEDLSGDPSGSEEVQFPSYRGELSEDVTFLGFDLTVDDVSSDWEADVKPALGSGDPLGTLGRDADGDLLGYYFVFEERPGEIRFGFDEGTADTATERPLGIAAGDDVTSVVPSWATERLEKRMRDPPEGREIDRTGWADFSWHNLVGERGTPEETSYVTIEDSQPGSGDWRFPSLSSIEETLDEETFDAFLAQFDDPPNAHDPAEWGKNGAHMARIAWQKPIRMSKHANRMLPDGDQGS